MINPLVDEHADKVMSLALAVRELSEHSDIANVASVLTFLLGATDLLRQEVPEARYDCEKFLGELRTVLADNYPVVLDHYFHHCLSEREANEQVAKVFQFPPRT